MDLVSGWDWEVLNKRLHGWSSWLYGNELYIRIYDTHESTHILSLLLVR